MSNDADPPTLPDVAGDTTVRRPRRTTYGAQPLTLIGDDGRRFKVTGMAVVGRSPTATPELGAVNLVVIDDASRSLSKTHAVLAYQDGRLWVIDRASTNGTAVSGATGTATVGSDQWVEAFLGEYLLFGDRWCQVADGAGPRPAEHSISSLPNATSAVGGRPNGVAAPTSAPAPPIAPPPAPVLQPLPPGHPSAGDSGVAHSPAAGQEPAGALAPPAAGDAVAGPGDPEVAGQAERRGPTGPPGPLTRSQRRRRRRARRRYLKAKRAREAAAAGTRPSRLRRAVTAVVAVVVVAGGAFGVRRIVLESDAEASDLPRLVTSVDEPRWTEQVDGTWLAPVAASGDVFASSKTIDATEASVTRLDGDTGDVVWTAGIGSATPWVSAVVDGVVLVTTQDDAGARRLVALAADDGSELWSADVVGDVVLSGGHPMVVAADAVTGVDPATGIGSAVRGDLVVLRGGAVMVMTAGEVAVHDVADLSGDETPATDSFVLPEGTELVTFDGSTVLASHGNEVSALRPDGSVRFVSELDVALADDTALAALAAIGRDAVLVVAESDALEAQLFELQAGAVRATWSGVAAAVVDAGPSGYIVETSAAGTTVRSTGDGSVVVRVGQPAQATIPARGHLAVLAADRLEAFEADSGRSSWSIDVTGSVATLVDDGLVVATYDPDDDTTELSFYR